MRDSRRPESDPGPGSLTERNERSVTKPQTSTLEVDDSSCRCFYTVLVLETLRWLVLRRHCQRQKSLVLGVGPKLGLLKSSPLRTNIVSSTLTPTQRQYLHQLFTINTLRFDRWRIYYWRLKGSNSPLNRGTGTGTPSRR